VPALQEGDWVLPESCAILRYLCNSRRVDDAWYPVRPRDRARIDAALDWHHATLRRGAAALVFARVFAGNNAEVASDPVRSR
jgi:glutathione S-transferase